MKHFGVWVGVLVTGLLVGCGAVGTEELGGEEVAESPRYTPEQVEAMLAEVPKPDAEMLQAFAAACQPTTTNSCVNAGYGACGNWSAYEACGELSTCGIGCRTRICDDFGCYFEYAGAQTQGRNRYRVCFNAVGQSCTEFEQGSSLVCGCAL